VKRTHARFQIWRLKVRDRKPFAHTSGIKHLRNGSSLFFRGHISCA